MNYKPNKYKVKDISLADQGSKKIEWARENMPVVENLVEKFSVDLPFQSLKICGAIHVTKETAVLIEALRRLGAEVAWAGCNPLSTQDDVAAQLAREGVKIFAWRGNHDEYYWCLDQVIAAGPDLTMDDGADLVIRLHRDHLDLLPRIKGGTEETTTGVHRLRNLAEEGRLRYPIIAVNDAETKWDFDNIYGTGQGGIDGLLRGLSILLAGKCLVVAGYGHCGKGIALRARGMGANVVVTEVDPIKALRALMDGYRVTPMKEAAGMGDIFITATGNIDVITRDHFPLLRSGAVLGNVGHFNVEVNVDKLERYAVNSEVIRPGVTRYDLPNGRHVYLLAEGRLFNLGIAEGHPSSVMDLSFANQILSLIRLVNRFEEMENKVYTVLSDQDRLVASMKLEAMGVRIDSLTQEQKMYLRSWSGGT